MAPLRDLMLLYLFLTAIYTPHKFGVITVDFTSIPFGVFIATSFVAAMTVYVAICWWTFTFSWKPETEMNADRFWDRGIQRGHVHEEQLVARP